MADLNSYQTPETMEEMQKRIASENAAPAPETQAKAPPPELGERPKVPAKMGPQDMDTGWRNESDVRFQANRDDALTRSYGIRGGTARVDTADTVSDIFQHSMGQEVKPTPFAPRVTKPKPAPQAVPYTPVVIPPGHKEGVEKPKQQPVAPDEPSFEFSAFPGGTSVGAAIDKPPDTSQALPQPQKPDRFSRRADPTTGRMRTLRNSDWDAMAQNQEPAKTPEESIGVGRGPWIPGRVKGAVEKLPYEPGKGSISDFERLPYEPGKGNTSGIQQAPLRTTGSEKQPMDDMRQVLTDVLKELQNSNQLLREIRDKSSGGTYS